MDPHPSSGQLLLGSVDDATASGAAFALGGLGFAGLDDAVDVAVGVAVGAAKKTKVQHPRSNNLVLLLCLRINKQKDFW